jgi:hypothetical protein
VVSLLIDPATDNYETYLLAQHRKLVDSLNA